MSKVSKGDKVFTKYGLGTIICFTGLDNMKQVVAFEQDDSLAVGLGIMVQSTVKGRVDFIVDHEVEAVNDDILAMLSEIDSCQSVDELKDMVSNLPRIEHIRRQGYIAHINHKSLNL